MKRTLLLVVFICCYRNAAGQLITESYQQVSLVRVLQQLESDYGVRFSYNPTLLKNKVVSVEADAVPLEELMQTLLTDQFLTLEQVRDGYFTVSAVEQYTVSFTVQDPAAKEPLPFAVARLKNSQKSFVADENGQIELTGSYPKDSVYELSFIGFEPLELNIHEINQLEEVALNPRPTQLNEVVIREYLNKGIVSNPSATTISILPQEMEILPGLTERDVLLTTQSLAGIGSNDETASGINVRGSAKDKTFIYWNNIPVYHPAHYFGNISAFIPTTIQEIKVYKNHIPVSYGGASAGLILAESEDAISDKRVVSANVNFTHGDVYARLPTGKKGNLMIAARRSYNDLLLTPTFLSYSNKLFDGTVTEELQESVSENNFEYNSKLAFSDVQASWNFRLSDKHLFSISGLQSLSELNYSSVNPGSTRKVKQVHRVKTYGASTNWISKWTPGWSSELSVTWADYSMRYRLTDSRPETSRDDVQIRNNSLGNLEVRLQQRINNGKNSSLLTGYQYNFYSNFIRNEEENFLERDLADTIETNEGVHAVFADYAYSFPGGIRLGGGARLNIFSTISDPVPDTHVRATFPVGKHFQFKTTAGSFNQYLTTLQETEFTFSNTTEQQWLLANSAENIPVVNNRQVMAGFLYQHKGWLIDLEGYRKRLTGLQARNLSPAFTGANAFLTATETIYGIDFLLRKRWRKYRIWASYTTQQSEAQLEEGERLRFTSALNSPHQVQVSQTLSLGRVELSLGYLFRVGLPYTRAVDLFFVERPEDDQGRLPFGSDNDDDDLDDLDDDDDFDDLDDNDDLDDMDDIDDDDFELPDDPVNVPNDDNDQEDDFDPFYEIIYEEEPNGSRLPNYHRVDFSIWYKFNQKPLAKIKGEIGLSLLNVLNTDNVFGRTYSVEENEDGNIILVVEENKYLGITPNLSIRLWF